MIVDIALSVVTVAVMIMLSYFGIASSERRRWPIGVGCLIGVLLVGLQAFRSTSAQRELHKTVGALTAEIQKLGTGLPKPHLPAAALRVSKIDVWEMGINQVTKANIHVENNGDAVAEGLYRVTRFAFVFSSPTSPAEGAVFDNIQEEIAKAKADGRGVAAGGRIFLTVEGPELHSDDFVPPNSPPGSQPRVSRNGKVLLLAGRLRYRSAAAGALERFAEFCVFVMNPNVLILCDGHNR